MTSDLDGVVAAAHARGVPVYVDEAWGPHLGFHPALPAGAMAAGADGAVTSTHKFLSSLSQTSLLNVRAGRVDPARVATTVRMTQTTSPLLPLLASLDACRRRSPPTASACWTGPSSWPTTPAGGCGCCPAWTCSAPTSSAWGRAASTP